MCFRKLVVVFMHLFFFLLGNVKMSAVKNINQDLILV